MNIKEFKSKSKNAATVNNGKDKIEIRFRDTSDYRFGILGYSSRSKTKSK